jgi:hypothetical protein
MLRILSRGRVIVVVGRKDGGVLVCDVEQRDVVVDGNQTKIITKSARNINDHVARGWRERSKTRLKCYVCGSVYALKALIANLLAVKGLTGLRA